MESAEALVCQALQASTNPNHEIVQKAEAQLNEWEQEPGFLPTLARICTQSDPNTDHLNNVNIRWMAAVYLKNCIDRYWRRNSKYQLPADQKQQIHVTLLKNFYAEEVPQVALQVAVLIARIARFDCPNEWPELLPELMKFVQTFNNESPSSSANKNAEQLQQQQQNVLLVLHHVIKALSSKRLTLEKREFEELTKNIFPYMYELWQLLTTQFFENVKTQPKQISLRCLERVHIITRSLRKLISYGLKYPYKSSDCMNFISQIFQRLRQCLELRYEFLQLHRDSAEIVAPLQHRLEHFIVKMLKIIGEMLDTKPISFANFVTVTLEFSFHYIFHEGTALIFSPTQVLNFPTFAIHAINFMTIILQSATYTVRSNRICSGMEDELRIVGTEALVAFYTNERLEYICEKLVTHYLLLTREELEEWQIDPEAFAQDDRAGDSWRFGLRPCVTTFYFTLFSQYDPVMTSNVLKYIQNAQQMQLTADADLKTILQKDAIYYAAGVASFHFFQEIDFGEWFTKDLLPELRIEAPLFRILRRRIIWLLGEWVSVQLPRPVRPLAYEACLHLLDSGRDMSIRLTTSRTLHSLVDDFDFLPLAFQPYFGALFNALFILLREAKECDTKISVLSTLSLLVDKMSDYIEPQAEQLISYLPLLWNESEDFNMLRCAIIGTLEQLVKNIHDIPEPMKPFLYSVIEFSTDVQNHSHIYLMEDGVVLWITVVENSTVLSPGLFALCKQLLPIIEQSTENLRSMLQLIHTYIILDAQAYLTRYGTQFIEYCMRMFQDITTEGVISMIRIFETCLKSDPIYGLNLIRPTLPYIFNEVYMDNDYINFLNYYLMIVARTLLIDQTVFMAVIQQLQQPNALEKVLDVWLDRAPLIMDEERRKLFCLAFSSIFSNNDLFLSRFKIIMQYISETLLVIMDVPDLVTDGGNNRDRINGSKCLGCGQSGSEEQSKDDEYNKSTAIATGAITSISDKNQHQNCVRFSDAFVSKDENDLDASKYALDFCYYKSYHFDRCRTLALKDPVHKISLTDYLDWQLKSLKQQLGAEHFEQLLETVEPIVLNNIRFYLCHSITGINVFSDVTLPK